MVTSAGAPIRALAAGHGMPLFDTQRTEFPGGVIAIMAPFTPYFIVKQEGDAFLVATRLQDAPLYWARKGDFYAWGTGEVMEMAGDYKIYARHEDAEQRKNEQRDELRHLDPRSHTSSIDAESNAAPLTDLPILSRSATVCAVLSPRRGGDLIWVNLADRVRLRSWTVRQ